MSISTWNDLEEYAEFTKEFVAYAEGAMKAGKSVDQAAEGYTLAPKYNGYVITVFEGLVTPKSNLQMAYDELKKK